MMDKKDIDFHKLANIKTSRQIRRPESVFFTFITLFRNYKSKFIFESKEVVICDKGSIDFHKIFIPSSYTRSQEMIALKIGKFSEISRDVKYVSSISSSFTLPINNDLIIWDSEEQLPSLPLTIIGNNVLLSTNSLVMPGVTIADGAVIGAGGVVIDDVPPYAIYGGNPAKFIKYRFEENIIEKLLQVRWWDFKYEYIVKFYKKLQHLKTSIELDEILASAKEIYDINNEEYLLFNAKYNGETKIEFTGIEKNNLMYKFQELPELFKLYFQQLNSTSNEIYVIDNIFSFIE